MVSDDCVVPLRIWSPQKSLIVCPVPASVVHPAGRLSQVRACVAMAVTRIHVFSTAVANLVPEAVPPTFIHWPTARPSVEKLRVPDPRPVAVAVMSVVPPTAPTTFIFAVARGEASSVMPDPTNAGTVADPVVHVNTPLFPATLKPEN